ncbi:MAG: hypothetical protein U0795_11140 [Pirellulales bacterium]
MASTNDRRGEWAREACYEAALVVEHTLRSLSAELRRADVTAEVDLPPNLILRGGFWELHRALQGLLLRALRRTAPGGELAVTVVEESHGIAFEIADDGRSVPDTVVDDEGHPMIAGRIHADLDEELQRVRREVAGLEATVVEQACPQGGLAVTLWLPRQSRRAAA